MDFFQQDNINCHISMQKSDLACAANEVMV